MKSSIHLLTISSLLLILFPSCEYLEDFEKGNGNIVPEKIDLEPFNRVVVGGNFEVILEEGENPQVIIVTDKNLHPFIKSEVHENTLEVIQERKLISKREIRMIITYTDLESIRITGAARVENEGILEEKALDIRMDGAGMVDLNVKTSKLNVFLSGAGVIKLSGSTDAQQLNLTGAGGLKAFDLESRECEVSVGGIGGAQIYVTEKLDARIEGVGGIEYDGNPSDIRTEINGLGKIKPVNENK